MKRKKTLFMDTQLRLISSTQFNGIFIIELESPPSFVRWLTFLHIDTQRRTHTYTYTYSIRADIYICIHGILYIYIYTRKRRREKNGRIPASAVCVY